ASALPFELIPLAEEGRILSLLGPPPSL
ncbi:hypothetical protein QQF64_003462, partial [Cirrhinus molitorella]